ncbi:MAG: hypothetical protein V3W41_22725 [Planctomycetota bacterium]
MNSGAPGGFECETFIAAWAEGAHTNTAIRHINECPYCRAMIHGEGDFLKPTEEQDANLAQHFAETQKMTERGFAPLSKTPWAPPADPKAEAYFEELKVRFAKELEDESDESTSLLPMSANIARPANFKKPGRRRMLKTAAVALGLVAIGGVGFYFGSNARVAGPDPIQHGVERTLEMGFRQIDRKVSAQGRPAVLALFGSGSGKQAATLVRWIADRNQTAYFDILALATFDNRLQVKFQARKSCDDVAPLDLKPYVSSIETAEQLETDQNWKLYLRDIVQRVKSA